MKTPFRFGSSAFTPNQSAVIDGNQRMARFRRSILRVAPTSMIFVPCKDGISHNEIEDARPEHLEAGANVLLHAMLARAGA